MEVQPLPRLRRVGEELALQVELDADRDPLEYYALIAVPSTTSVKQTEDILSDYRGQLLYGQQGQGGTQMQLLVVPFRGSRSMRLLLEGAYRGHAPGLVLIRHIEGAGKPAAKALDLTLTSRNKNEPDAIPMCGVPHHAAHGYISDKARYLARLKRIEGQARGIHRMVEEEKYCIDILTQVSALTSALQVVAVGLKKKSDRKPVRKAKPAAPAA